MSIESIAPEGVLTISITWLAMRLGNLESRIESLATALKLPSPKPKRKWGRSLIIIGAFTLAFAMSGCGTKLCIEGPYGMGLCATLPQAVPLLTNPTNKVLITPQTNSNPEAHVK